MKDRFITLFDESFFASEPFSALTLSRNEGPLVGKMLDAGVQKAYFAGNIYRQLCQPLGDHHLLDMRAHATGIGIAGYFVWNPADRPFERWHVERANVIQRLMQQAHDSGSSETSWISTGSGSAHLIADSEGKELLAIDGEAESILQCSHLLLQTVSMTRQPRNAPGFVASLAKQLNSAASAQLQLAVPSGRLVCKASRTTFFEAGGENEQMVFVSLDPQVPVEVAKINYVFGLTLSPLQKEIAAFAICGGDRQECLDELGISSEALKKHLRPVFRETGAASWSDLQKLPSSQWFVGELARQP